MPSILSIENIKKSYHVVQALKGVSFEVPKGSVFGVLGPNGSGKTTLLGILLDVLKADSGQFEWIGYPNDFTARKNIGSLLETPNFYHYMTAKDNLILTAHIKERGLEDVDRVLQQVNLYERRDSKFSTFSLGMKQRLAIAGALLGKPDILVLDEPTNGLDPVGISEIRNLIRSLNQDGITVIMASHLLDEVEKVCTHVAILKQGVLLSSGPVGHVSNDEEWIELGASNKQLLANALTNNSLVKSIRVEECIHIVLQTNASIEDINSYCMQQGIVLNHIQKRKRSLESKFMEITK